MNEEKLLKIISEEDIKKYCPSDWGFSDKPCKKDCKKCWSETMKEVIK